MTLVETIMTEKTTLSDIEKLTDEELAKLQLRIAEIIDARTNERRETLIKNFEEAFSALQDANINVSVDYSCGDCGYHEEHYVYLDDISYEY